MKKFLFIIPMLLLAWCWTTQTQEISQNNQENQQQVQEEQIVQDSQEDVVLYIGDDEAWFVMDTASGPIYLFPAMFDEQTTLKSNNMFEQDAVAGEYSKFAVVGFLFLNDSKETAYFSAYDIPDLFDSEWRKYETSFDYTNNFYLPSAVSNLEVRAWIPTKWYVVYEVAKDSEWFYMESANGKILMQEKSE